MRTLLIILAFLFISGSSSFSQPSHMEPDSSLSVSVVSGGVGVPGLQLSLCDSKGITIAQTMSDNFGSGLFPDVNSNQLLILKVWVPGKVIALVQFDPTRRRLLRIVI